MSIRVDIKSEAGASRDPAKVLVYEDDLLVVEIIAEVGLKRGADGGYYHCVVFKKKENEGSYFCLL